jgi:hypothetical protein
MDDEVNEAKRLLSFQGISDLDSDVRSKDILILGYGW